MAIGLHARRLLFTSSCIGISCLSVKRIVAESEFSEKPNSNLTKLILEPLSKTFFPTEWSTENAEPQQLIGMGVRSVTLLQFHAYSIGFYASNSAIQGLKKSSRWIQEFSPSKWSGSSSESRNFYVRNLVDGNELSLMICPIRPTDGVHLRNGFVKLLQSKFDKESKSLGEQEKQELTKAIDDFKVFFPSKAIPKGTRIVFSRGKEGSLTCSIAGSFAGRIEQSRLSEWFFEGFLLGDEISPSFVRSIGIGLYEQIHTS